MFKYLSYRSVVLFQTVTSCPVVTRLIAMLLPMIPSPRKPIFLSVAIISLGVYCVVLSASAVESGDLLAADSLMSGVSALKRLIGCGMQQRTPVLASQHFQQQVREQVGIDYRARLTAIYLLNASLLPSQS